MKIVIDTNVVISGIFFGGEPNRLLQHAINNELEVFVSKEIVDEYKEVVARIAEKYPNRPKKFPLDIFVSSCRNVEPKKIISVCRDKDDNKFIECAYEAKCLYIVSGDNDLLSLENYADIKIVPVADFLHKLEDLK